MMRHDHPAVIVSPTIDAVTVEVAHDLLLQLKAEDTPVDIAAEVTAEFIAVMLAEYPPLGRCDVCGELWAFDEHDLCHREGDAPDEQWQVTTPAEVFA